MFSSVLGFFPRETETDDKWSIKLYIRVRVRKTEIILMIWNNVSENNNTCIKYFFLEEISFISEYKSLSNTFYCFTENRTEETSKFSSILNYWRRADDSEFAVKMKVQVCLLWQGGWLGPSTCSPPSFYLSLKIKV